VQGRCEHCLRWHYRAAPTYDLVEAKISLATLSAGSGHRSDSQTEEALSAEVRVQVMGALGVEEWEVICVVQCEGPWKGLSAFHHQKCRHWDTSDLPGIVNNFLGLSFALSL
jgi:hypothetical protein